MRTLAQLKGDIRQLPPDQLGELRTYISGLLEVGGGSNKSALPQEGESNSSPRSNPASWFWATFSGECGRLGLTSISRATRTRVDKQALQLQPFLDRACPDRTLHRFIVATGIKLLYDDLQTNSRMVNSRNLAYSLDRLPAVLDRSFPGYAACGALSIIVRGRRLDPEGGIPGRG